MRIGVVAPGSRFAIDTAEQVSAIAERSFPDVELVFHANAFSEHGHFAGTDAERAAAIGEFGNDPGFDAIWFARGGYGACRIAEAAIAGLVSGARDKMWLGYSDAGYLLAGLYRAGFPHLAHGPMPQDARRQGGEEAIVRALAWLSRRDATALEPGLDARYPQAAFNLTVLSLLLGTPLEPDLSGHILHVEEVSEQHYRIDRHFFHLVSSPAFKGIAGLRLGACEDIPANDPEFGASEEEIARFWCARAEIPFLGRSLIGHHAGNRIVPFGSLAGHPGAR